MTTINTITTMAVILEQLAAKLQEEGLKARRLLFFDPERGFNHNVGGVRTNASIKNIEVYINNISGGLVQFKFRSHRMLWFTIRGVAKRYVISAPNQFDYNTEDLDDTNPYLKIEDELMKAASELRIMERAYNKMLIAA